MTLLRCDEMEEEKRNVENECLIALIVKCETRLWKVDVGFVDYEQEI
jgi:hypothetical protein